MLSRAFTKPKRNPKNGNSITRSESILDEYEDCIVGFMDDIPLVVCEAIKGDHGARSKLTLREVLRASVGVMGESCLGITEKVVVSGGKVCTLKRFRALRVRKGEFGRRLQRVAQINRRCEYLVPVSAYLYSKRIKFVLCEYYPMGSLHDLLSGARTCGHTALSWNQRLNILFTAAQAILFIHSLSPPKERKMQMNVHGNIKSANIMINTDFTACLSGYGFAQLAHRAEVTDTEQCRMSPSPAAVTESPYSDELSQKGDIHNFGVVMLDVVGGGKAMREYRRCILQKKKEIMDGRVDFFDFSGAEAKERNQAMQVFEIAHQCTNEVAEERPSIEHIVKTIRKVMSV